MKGTGILPAVFAFAFAFALDGRAQEPVAIRALSAPLATSMTRFGHIENVRGLVDGGALVNDAHHRRLVALDSTLSSERIVLDSTSEGEFYYSAGPFRKSLLAYVGDSSAIQSDTSSTFLIINPNGAIAHRRVTFKPGQLPLYYAYPRGFDRKGDPFYADRFDYKVTTSGKRIRAFFDQIMHLDSDARMRNVVAEIERGRGYEFGVKTDSLGSRLAMFVNPLLPTNDWVVLSTGEVALVFGRDYRVDIRQADGTRTASNKIPYLRKKLNEQDKLAVMDSVQRELLEQFALLNNGAKGHVEFAPLKEMPSVFPPFGMAAAKPDLDGNVWIKTVTSHEVRPGEPVFDVINNRGVLTYRVRIPKDRSIAGFGHDNIVFLKYKDGANGWALERRRILN